MRHPKAFSSPRRGGNSSARSVSAREAVRRGINGTVPPCSLFDTPRVSHGALRVTRRRHLIFHSCILRPHGSPLRRPTRDEEDRPRLLGRLLPPRRRLRHDLLRLAALPHE